MQKTEFAVPLLYFQERSIDIYRGLNACVTHDRLNYLYIRFILTEACTERVPRTHPSTPHTPDSSSEES